MNKIIISECNTVRRFAYICIIIIELIIMSNEWLKLFPHVGLISTVDVNTPCLTYKRQVTNVS